MAVGLFMCTGRLTGKAAAVSGCRRDPVEIAIKTVRCVQPCRNSGGCDDEAATTAEEEKEACRWTGRRYRRQRRRGGGGGTERTGRDLFGFTYGSERGLGTPFASGDSGRIRGQAVGFCARRGARKDGIVAFLFRDGQGGCSGGFRGSFRQPCQPLRLAHLRFNPSLLAGSQERGVGELRAHDGPYPAVSFFSPASVLSLSVLSSQNKWPTHATEFTTADSSLALTLLIANPII
ncbi:predicted protein [Coccidioides posadasii str. Silveira]|uniref:Predicted protein n=1 Tax=Coccidioides posadasii (strain RMSCC 757 / Silveira) TaxID=443226 RepID=E9DE89_COCPS|nr:predicted protein [Coccidioides posadasii str. Silveira]